MKTILAYVLGIPSVVDAAKGGNESQQWNLMKVSSGT